MPGQPATDIKIQKFQFTIYKKKPSIWPCNEEYAVAQQTVTEGRNQEDKKQQQATFHPAM